MKIISDFKDYYDFLQNYYGVDNILLYQRKNKILKVSIQKLERVHFIEQYQIDKNHNKLYGLSKKTEYTIIKRINYLFFCGKIYKLDYIKQIDSKNNVKTIFEVDSTIHYSGLNEFYNYCIENNLVCANLYDIELGHDLFNREIFYKIELNPKLVKLNFSEYLQAEQVYQMIEQYLGNLKTNEVIIEVDNKTKITQAGFDLKTSFRKRGTKK